MYSGNGDRCIRVGYNKNGENIEFKDKDGKKFEPGNDKEDTQKDPYLENTWDEKSKTYTNNTTISGESKDGNGSGVKLSGDLDGMSFINKGTIAGTANEGYGNGSGIYNEGTITELENNGAIAGTSSGSSGSGIYNYSSGTIETLTNKGTIAGTSSGERENGSGIYNKNATIETLTNKGTIAGTSSGSYGNGSGIYNKDATIETLTNNGSITGTSNSGYGSGIYNQDIPITELTNNGSITGTTNASGVYHCSYGIYNGNNNLEHCTVGTLKNNGTIIGTSTESESYGIYNSGGYIITTLTNTGVISGKTNAILNDSATISYACNYGLLVSKDGSVVENKDNGGDGTVGFAEDKLGLAF